MIHLSGAQRVKDGSDIISQLTYFSIFCNANKLAVALHVSPMKRSHIILGQAILFYNCPRGPCCRPRAYTSLERFPDMKETNIFNNSILLKYIFNNSAFSSQLIKMKWAKCIYN